MNGENQLKSKFLLTFKSSLVCKQDNLISRSWTSKEKKKKNKEIKIRERKGAWGERSIDFEKVVREKGKEREGGNNKRGTSERKKV